MSSVVDREHLRNHDLQLFETFYLRVVHIDPNIEYVAILQFYFILHVTGADIESLSTSLAKLRDY